MRKAFAVVTVCLSLFMVLVPAGAAENEFPDVANTSFVATNGERTMRLSIVVPAGPHAVWQSLSTAEGWKSWAAPTAYVDFREGGQIETNYQKEKPQGSRENIRNQIIAIIPDQVLVFRNVQAPPDFKYPELFGQIVTTIKLEPADGNQTRVTISGAGYRSTPEFDALFKQFTWGNSYSLVELRKSFAGGVEPGKTAAPSLKNKGAQ